MTKPIRRPGSAMYYARRVIPKDLRETFGRTEIWRSLDTRDLETAKPRERRQQAAWDEQFRETRARLPVTQETRPSAPFSDWSIDPEVAAAEDAAWEREMEEYDARTEADPVLWAERQARIAAAEERANIQVHLSVLREQKEKAAAKATDFQTLVDAWAAHKTRQAKSIDRMGAVVRRFQKETGVSAVEAVTPDHVHTFRKALLDSTSRANGNTILRNFNTLLRFAVMEARLIANNPADGISIAVERDPENDVHSFDLPALKRVFGSPVYASDHRPEAGSGEAAYWLPLLALYSGARLNEFPAVLASDIASSCAVRKEPGLSWALQCARMLLRDNLFSAAELDRLVSGLEFLRSETEYSNWNVDDPRTPSLSLVRRECVRLAAALIERGVCDEVLTSWVDLAIEDPVPEVRFALVDLDDAGEEPH